jgi:Rps23 Pro-64 3,4-dihydroxylase Tpa1-like proline 4-hydroxylase
MIDPVAPPDVRSEPFAHTSAVSVLPTELCAATLVWLENAAPWKLRVASFYEQWEIHISADALPAALKALCLQATIAHLVKTMIAPLNSGIVKLSEITAHKLVAGQTIKIHNDFLDGQETYRLLVQLNRGWRDELGGMLMLFSSPSPDDVRRVIRPLHGSAFAFAISHRSFHAVSTVRSGERYTLVYSFRDAALTHGHG